MAADLIWRSSELRIARRHELTNLKVDREWDWRMRLFGHTAIIVLIALFSAMALDGPRFLLITLPLGALAVAIEIRRLQKDKKAVGLTTAPDISAKRRQRGIVLASCVVVFAIGLFINALPSQEFHDKYWFLLVAPVMISAMVAPVALLMLGWTYLPRRDEELTAR
jgi:peptidoglycan/LPS O-acetylase OafA/YrhL